MLHKLLLFQLFSANMFTYDSLLACLRSSIAHVSSFQSRYSNYLCGKEA